MHIYTEINSAIVRKVKTRNEPTVHLKILLLLSKVDGTCILLR
jgi:hypothetical protein